jgi:hypothetical protein
MPEQLKVRIVRFVDPDQPGWVECEFVDALGRTHVLRDKVPIFTAEDLWAGDNYPQPGFAPCEILTRWRDHAERELVRITTAMPCGIESNEGLSEFVVLADALT